MINGFTPETLSIQLSANELMFCTARQGTIQRVGHCPLCAQKTWSVAVREILVQHEMLNTDAQRIHVILDTDRVCLIPVDYYQVSFHDSYLQCAGFPSDAALRAVATAPRNDIMALVGMDSTVYDDLYTHYGERLVYTHPLLLAATADHDAIPLFEATLTGEFVHLTARDRGLLFAETLPRKTEADLLYYIDFLRKNYSEIRFRILVSGTDAPVVHRNMKRYFKRVHLHLPSSTPSVWGDCAIDKTFKHSFTHLIRSIHENN